MSDSNENDFINRQRDTKISDFVGTQTLQGADYVTVVQNGTNKKMTVADFLLSLGFEGELIQTGAVTGTPVLDPQGAINGIRNLENGPGVKANVSPENGITLEHNFISDTFGAPVLINPSQLNPTVASIAPGPGISVSAVDQHIVIAASATPVTTKTVIVSTLSDFPAAVDGVITFDDDTEYLLINDVESPHRFQLGSKNSLRSGSSTLTTLTYTGVSAMFTGSDASFKIAGMTLSCVNSPFVGLTSPTGVGIFQCVETTISCNSGGTIDGGFLVRMDAVAWDVITNDGIDFSGTIQIIIYTDNIVFLLGGDFINLTTAVISNIILENIIVHIAGVGTTFLVGDTDSANIAVGGLASLSNARIAGPAAPLSGITTDDIRWKFNSNTGVSDTRPDALISIVGNSTETVISSANAPVKAAGVWTIDGDSHFTSDTTGRITYNGETNFTGPIDFSTTILMAAGGDKQVTVYVAINGAVVIQTGKQGTASSSKAASITVIWQHEFVTGDYVEVWVENNDDATNIVLQQAVGRIN